MNLFKIVFLLSVSFITTACISFDVKDVSQSIGYSKFIGVKLRTVSDFTILKDLPEEEGEKQSFQLILNDEIKPSYNEDSVSVAAVPIGSVLTVKKVQEISLTSLLPSFRVAYIEISINGKLYYCRTSAIFELDASALDTKIKTEHVREVN